MKAILFQNSLHHAGAYHNVHGFQVFCKVWVATCLLTLLVACSYIPQSADHSVSSAYVKYPEGGGIYVSSTFAPDGSLWRVVPGRNHVFVDHSEDQGNTFSPPVKINREEQKIKASGENRPGILVDRSGYIYVLYAAEGKQPSALFYSVSIDNGLTFSIPLPISDAADEANTFQGKIGLDHAGKVFAYWHDERTRTDWRQLGNAIYSTQIDVKDPAPAPAQKISDVLCDCCRIAVAFNNRNQAILFTRFVYDGNIRDHGIVQTGKGGNTWRVTFDDWTIEACPEHGPAISIDNDNTYHIAWFTQGKQREGLFYANSSDEGHHFSKPMTIGDKNRLPSHPDILAINNRIFLTWTEFDGNQTLLFVQQSVDGGKTWKPAQPLASYRAEADYPFLLHSKAGVFVSWNSKTEGYHLLPVK